MANNLAAFNTQAFSKLLVKNLDQINVMMPLVNKDYEGEFANIGDTVNVRTLGSITTGTWSTNGTISYQDLAPVTEAMVINDAQYFAFKVDDVNTAQNDLDALALYAQRAAVQISNLIEAKLLGVYASALAANQITGASSAAITLDSTTGAAGIYTNLVVARGKLSKQNVPFEGRWAVVDPDTTALLLQDTAHFVRATDLGDQVVQGGMGPMGRPGFIGRCVGFDVYESNAIPVVSSAKYLMYGTRRAISYAAQLKEVETIRLETTFATAVRGILLHGVKVFAEASKALGYIKAAA